MATTMDYDAMPITLSANLLTACTDVYQSIGHDVPHNIPNVDIIEIVIDCSRLDTFGHASAALELRALFNNHGYAAVMGALDNNVHWA